MLEHAVSSAYSDTVSKVLPNPELHKIYVFYQFHDQVDYPEVIILKGLGSFFALTKIIDRTQPRTKTLDRTQPRTRSLEALRSWLRSGVKRNREKIEDLQNNHFRVSFLAAL